MCSITGCFWVGSVSSSYCSSLMSLIQSVFFVFFLVVLFNDFLELEIRNVSFVKLKL